LALTLVSCTNYDFRVIVPESTKEVNKVLAAAKPKPVDILFMVDNSGSMADEQALLAASFQSFIDVLSANPDNDYKLAVITTDAGDLGFPQTEAPDELEFDGLVTNRYAAGPYFENNGSDFMTACVGHQVPGVPHGCFRGPDPAKRIITSAMPAAEQVTAFQANVKVGSCGSGVEQGLITPLIALGRACNQGFIRPEANLVIVMVSDEEDSSPNRNYVQEILTAAGKSASQLRVAVVVGSKDGRAEYCGTQPTCGESVCALGRPTQMSNPGAFGLWAAVPDSCKSCSYFNAPDCCAAFPGGRYIDFANDVEDAVRAADSTVEDVDCRGASGQRVACIIDTICQSNFGATLARIARDLVVTNTYALNPPAKYPPGVVVEVNGMRLTNCASVMMGEACDFSVTTDGAQVSITNAEKVPKEDDTLSIYFVIEE